MAHDVRTARRYYDVHGITEANKRIAGVGSLIRIRQRNRLAETATTADDDDEEASTNSSSSASPARELSSPAAAAATNTTAAAATTTTTIAAAAATNTTAAAASPCEPGSPGPAASPKPAPRGPSSSARSAKPSPAGSRLRWTAEETLLLQRAAEDMIVSGVYSAALLYSRPGVKEGLAQRSRQQVYQKFKHLRDMYQNT